MTTDKLCELLGADHDFAQVEEALNEVGVIVRDDDGKCKLTPVVLENLASQWDAMEGNGCD